MFFGLLSLYLQQLSGISIDPTPVAIIINPCPCYTLVNSVDFHPQKNLFCVTYTHSNIVALYKIDAAGKPKMVQILSNPSAALSEPQHAVFSPDGEKIVVANWTNQTLTVYRCEEKSFFSKKPAAVIPSDSRLAQHKPHGIAFSPCGKFLAIAYGAANYYQRAIALLRMTKEGMGYELVDVLQGVEALPGIPKGITFSPDGTCLLVTFSDANCLVIYDLAKQDQTIALIPRQIIRGQETKISRPEDVKISPDGNCCAITNSDQHTVTFYPFDKISNQITQNTPSYVLQNPEAHLCFPHGIAFSPDGSFLLVTEFGPIRTTKEEDIAWDTTMRPDQAKISIYKI